MQNWIISRFWFCRRLGRLKINIRWIFCVFGSKTFVPISWLCKKQTSVSHSSTEAELISLDAGLRMDGLTALVLWEFGYRSISLFSNSIKEYQRSTTRCVIPHQTSTSKTKLKTQPSTTIILSWVMLIMFRRTWSLLYLVRCSTFLRTMKLWFIKIIKGPSPQWDMYPEPTELLWIGCLTGLILIPKFRFDTKHQLADILIKGNFTRDEWNDLLRLLNISHFSSTCCAQNSSMISCTKTMAKRMQAQKGKGRIVAKSKSTAMNLSSHVPASSSSAKSPISSSDPGKRTATSKPESRMRRNSKSDVASSSQVRLQDACLGGLMDIATGKLVATEESSDVDHSESGTWSFQEEAVTVRPVACKTATGKPNASSKSDHPGNPKAESGASLSLLFFCCRTSLDRVICGWAQLHQNRKKKRKNRMATQSTRTSSHNSPYGSSLLEHQEKLRTRTRWSYGWLGRDYGYLGIFLNATLQAVVHLGQDYEANLRFVKNHLLNSVESLFHETGRLIREQTEITVVNTIHFNELTWMSTSFLCEKAYQITNAKTYVFSDSMLCGKNERRSYCNLEEQI